MNRLELINRIKRKYPQTLHEIIESVVKSIFKIMRKQLESFQRIELREFGTFCVRNRRIIPASHLAHTKLKEATNYNWVYFRAAKRSKERVNGL